MTSVPTDTPSIESDRTVRGLSLRDLVVHNRDPDRAYVLRVSARETDATRTGDGDGIETVYHVPAGETVAATDLLSPGRYAVTAETDAGARDVVTCLIDDAHGVAVELGNGAVSATGQP
jgi:hypothetical protein